MKQIIPEQKVMVEVKISGHVSSREELSQFLFLEPYSDHKFRGVVHIDGNMEWQWAKTEEEAEEWVKRKLSKYIML